MTLTKEKIEQLELQLVEAIKISDIEFIDRVIHDDLLCVVPTGETITKEIDLASHKRGAKRSCGIMYYWHTHLLC